MIEQNKSNGPRIGLITMMDPNEDTYEYYRNNVGMDLEEGSRSMQEMIVSTLEQSGCEVLIDSWAKSQAQSLAAVDRLIAKSIEALVIHVPLWSHPSMSAGAARLAHARGVPVLLWGTIVVQGAVAARGAVEELGIPLETALGTPGTPRVDKKVAAFARAASTKRRLEGSTLGIIGGRSLGINLGTVDTAQIQRMFGIDVDHTDQFEIVRLAPEMPEQEVRRHVKYLEEKFAAIDRDGGALSDKSIELSVRSYLATKKIIADKGYDFIGLKCLPELADRFVNQCLTATFLNDPYDIDGQKEPTVCACESDCNGALSMQILQLISGGKPALLVDTTLVPPGETNVILCQNCGAAATCFASVSGTAADSLKRVRVVPNHTGKAVGPAIHYLAEPQDCVTWARLSRRAGKYRMHVIRAKMGAIDEAMAAMLSRWPTALLSIDTPDIFEFLESYNSMHLHLVAGDYVDELVQFCKLMDIECIRM